MATGFNFTLGVVAALVLLFIGVPMALRLFWLAARAVGVATTHELCGCAPGGNYYMGECVRPRGHFGNHAKAWEWSKESGCWYRTRFTSGYGCYASWGEHAEAGIPRKKFDKPLPPLEAATPPGEAEHG